MEFERDMIASRIRDSRAGLVARDRRIARVTPFGYTGDSRTKQLMPVPAEAEVVREFFRQIAEGTLPREIAPTGVGRSWKTCVVRSVLIELKHSFPGKRRRPTRASVALDSLEQVLRLLDHKGAREFIRQVVQEVVWNPIHGAYASRST